MLLLIFYDYLLSYHFTIFAKRYMTGLKNKRMKKIGVLSDTHGWLHPQIFTFFKECDEIWHAGDICDVDVIDQLLFVAPVKAVFGNCDEWDIRSRTSEYLIFSCEKHTVALMHITGYPGKYELKTKEIIAREKPTIFVGGHSHILKVMHDTKNNLLFINPGAAGRSGIHTHITMLRFKIDGKKIVNMDIFDEVRKLEQLW